MVETSPIPVGYDNKILGDLFTFNPRDDEGNLKYAEAKRILDGYRIIAKEKAIRASLEYCITNHLTLVELEKNSMTMKNFLDGIWEVPWNIIGEVKDINKLRRNRNAIVVHVYMEGRDSQSADIEKVGGSDLNLQSTPAPQPIFHRTRSTTRSESIGIDGEVKRLEKEGGFYRWREVEVIGRSNGWLMGKMNVWESEGGRVID
ncbi:hypothetical protein HAX54_027511 [Datura stramonium]|uniref:Uncharacterized protein n=1 Tax=Datura stramonium TaxID=4076 RepID=A0ABS8S8X1_DATST|nr:hypothetical protein [Datura stramonium]